MRISVLSLGLLLGAVVGGAACKSDSISCPPILVVGLTRPDTTTIKVAAATIAIAGATYGGCEQGPPPPDFAWTASDSTVVRVTALDSIHARIIGLRPGVAAVTPRYRHDPARASPPPVTVTVVP